MRAALPETSWSLRDCQTSDRTGTVVSCAEVAILFPDVSGKVDDGLSATDKVLLLAWSLLQGTRAVLP